MDDTFDDIDTDSDDEFAGEDDNLVRKLRHQLKDAQKAAKAASEAQAKLAELERKEAVRAAGLNLSDKQLKALFSDFEGEMTPDSLKAAAADLGFVAKETEATPEEVAAHQAINQATAQTGATPPLPSRLLSIRQQVEKAPVSQLPALQAELYQAIAEAGLQFGDVDHDGRFVPTGK